MSQAGTGAGVSDRAVQPVRLKVGRGSEYEDLEKGKVGARKSLWRPQTLSSLAGTSLELAGHQI